MSYACERLHEKEIVVTADVFGTVIGSETDIERVGQNYAALGNVVDVLSPMVYPSHYRDGVYGIDHPDFKPYETVSAALQASNEILSGIPQGEHRAAVRPWLQDFTATWVKGHIPYGAQEVRAQIQAVYDAGYEEWILWNASNHYTEDALLPAEDAKGGGSETADDEDIGRRTGRGRAEIDMTGTLFLCATPIGNLGDMTKRVIATLAEVDLIAAEDTRNSIKLLNHFGIRTPMTSYHEYNKVEKADQLVGLLLEGKNIALITDAGTPAISDRRGACGKVPRGSSSGYFPARMLRLYYGAYIVRAFHQKVLLRGISAMRNKKER